MQLAILAAVLAALASAEAGGGPVDGLAWRLSLVAISTLVAPLAALVGAQRLVHALEVQREEDAAAIARLQGMVVGLWLSAVAIVLFLAQWPRIVRANWELANVPLLDELAILLPVIAPLVLVWAALYRLERAAQLAACEAAGIARPPARLWSYIGLHVRHHLGLVVLPALAIVGLYETLKLVAPSADDAAIGSWLVLPAIGLMLALMPLAVRTIWRTTPLPAGQLRDELEAVCAGRRLPVSEILVWHTDGYTANAAVVGLLRWPRYVLLSDALLARLSAQETAAVLRHELAHVRRRHLLLRLAVLALPLAAWLAVKSQWPQLETPVNAWLSPGQSPGELLPALLVPAAMLCYAVIAVGSYSRLLEHEADLDACCDDAGDFQPTLADDFARALKRLTGRETESRLSRWLHPATELRLQLLDDVAAEKISLARHRRPLRWIASVLALLYGIAAALALASAA
jgi:Zn-dependent protease with chaperone function